MGIYQEGICSIVYFVCGSLLESLGLCVVLGNAICSSSRICCALPRLVHRLEFHRVGFRPRNYQSDFHVLLP